MKYKEYIHRYRATGFWADQANQIAWYSKPKNILSKDENDYPLVQRR
jgi:propionyl-CoA synthetase